MGIPAYYSYLIKNFKKIIVKKERLNKNVHNFYLDSNSIIYNCLATLKEVKKNEIVNILIKEVCLQIDKYIKDVAPKKLVYISFDGVAPVAKLKQQKERRFKSKIIAELVADCIKEQTGVYPESKQDEVFDRTCITPGTEFMNKLNLQIKYHFRTPIPYKVNQIIVSGSDEPGEGEHKIFEYIRDNSTKILNDKTVIYGLDADLIMLTINHLQYNNNMYLFRETPDFIKSIDKSLDPNCLYMIDIPQFKDNMVLYLNNDIEPKTVIEKNRVFDYIFLCFLLGNDFLPHFPALNIRNNGMDIVLETYRNVIGNKCKNLVNNNKIIWKNVRLLIQELGKNEQDNIIQEYKIRNKMEKRDIPFDDKTSKFDKEMLYAPSKERQVEKYINPFDDYWEARYYDMLIDIHYKDEEAMKKLSLNYLEGLEWTFKYYSSGCVDWRWCYKYHYPPLLKDLLKYIPYFDEDLIDVKEKLPVTELVQLSYVLPKNSLYLLPRKIEHKLLSQYESNYKMDYEFQWAFCKYFWECHVDFPDVSVEQIEDIVNL